MTARSIMAGRLLSGALAALLVQGCLIPQDDQMIGELPPQKNRPPRIIRGAVTPPAVTTVTLGTKCSHQEFRVPVEDPDLADQIRNKWFIDDDSFVGAGLDGRIVQPVDGGTALRNVPVKPPDQIFNGGSALVSATPKPHKLTVVIADGEFVEGITLAERVAGLLSDGGLLLNPAYTDTFTWDVTTDLTPCP